jgi:glycosyltransferase involved in cell wall biosynthesis
MPENTLVILTPGFPANEADTTCLPAQQQFVQNVQESFPGLKIIVLSFHYPYINSTYTWKNVTVVSFNGRNRGKLQRLMLWARVRRKLSVINRTHRIIGLFSFWCTECALVGKYFAKPKNIKHLTWILGQDAKANNKYVRLIKPKANELVAMSDFLADSFEVNHGVRPQYTVPNGIDPRGYPSPAGERNIDVLGAGSLIKLKQYDLFVELVALVKNQLPNIRAVICGKGPEQQALLEQIDQLNIAQNVSLAGEFQHPEVLRHMQQSKVFLHTSYYEGFSTVCLEALYAGAHVISFCNPGPAYIPHWHIVNHKEEMLDKLLQLLTTPSLEHNPVLVYSMKDSAREVMKLFGYET